MKKIAQPTRVCAKHTKKTRELSYTLPVPDAFDFSTSEIQDWELELIHAALIREEIDITDHARKAARE